MRRRTQDWIPFFQILLSLFFLCALTWGPSSSLLYGDEGKEEPSVHPSLLWLAKHQMNEGRWDPYEYIKQCPQSKRCKRITDKTSRKYTIAVTGMSILSFLNKGFNNMPTERAHEWDGMVKKGLVWLHKNQKENGRFGVSDDGVHLFNQVIATMAFVKATPTTTNPMIISSARKGIAYLKKARNKDGFWGDTYQDPETDRIVTRWSYRVFQLARHARDIHDFDIGSVNVKQLHRKLKKQEKEKYSDVFISASRKNLERLTSYHAEKGTHQQGSWASSSTRSLLESKVNGRVMKTALYATIQFREFKNENTGKFHLPILYAPDMTKKIDDQEKEGKRIWNRYREKGLQSALDSMQELELKQGVYHFIKQIFLALQSFQNQNKNDAISHLRKADNVLSYFPQKYQKKWSSRVLKEDDIANWVQAKVNQLGDQSYENRKQASRELKDVRYLVQSRLQSLLKSSDPEVRIRIKKILQLRTSTEENRSEPR